MHPNDHSPGIPPRLLTRPTMGGLVVPYTTLRLPDGRWRFGAVDSDRQADALINRLCQTCGDPLERRIVFAMRDMDLDAMSADEPGMHPECAAYTALACPMLAGRMSHHQTTSIEAQLSALGIAFDGDPTTQVRLGRPASPWSLAWTSGYSVYTHPTTQRLAARMTPAQLLRVRPIVSATPEGRS
ncbi:hypothetical protein HDA40_003719 [Hamadaea flava]|uniref:DUF2695 domain-containing protein n=1 Tax=Hamadaea flava TaxID=1742688 RepID=A0ABV8LK22_9ACTN|nr:hypothetical protein [Hamadaea flava]MCP2325212.1 hypothetical protein [Hamadaea flava]